MMNERRRVHRFLFEAPVELTHAESHASIMSVTGDIGVFGCFVKTPLSFPKGSKVKLRITQQGRTFSATGEVLYVVTNEGMGIAYGELAAKDYAILQEWLAVQNTEPILLRR
jgi:hypothetical protein